VRCAGHRAKLRTGGTTAQAFPDAGTLAAAIGECVLLDLPFKCTAGLHHAVAHVDPATGFAHHGFLNVLLAAAAAADGAGARGVERALTSTRPEVVRCVTALGPQGVAAARARFVSFGTCSVEEPVEDLLALGLLPAPAPAPGGVR
jgi:hypothetical protein